MVGWLDHDEIGSYSCWSIMAQTWLISEVLMIFDEKKSLMQAVEIWYFPLIDGGAEYF